MLLLCRYLLGYQEGGGGLMGCVEGFTNMGTDEQLALPITTSSTYQSLAPTTTISTESTGARSPVVVRPAQPSDAGTLAANKKRDTSGSKVCPTKFYFHSEFFLGVAHIVLTLVYNQSLLYINFCTWKMLKLSYPPSLSSMNRSWPPPKDLYAPKKRVLRGSVVFESLIFANPSFPKTSVFCYKW